MLKEIVHDQIAKQVKPKLGKVAQKGVQPVVFNTPVGESTPEDATLQWGKRSYVQDRGGNVVLSRDDFLNYRGSIPRTILSPSVGGALIDSNLPIGTNIEYAVEVYTELISKTQPVFNLHVGGGSRASVYMRIKTGDSGEGLADYTVFEMATGISNSSVSLNLNAGQWATLLVYLYSASDDTYIRGFDGLMSVVDSWRMPDIIPPAIPVWADTPLETSADPISGQTYNTVRWNFPNNNDVAGHGIYVYSEEDTGYDVEEQSVVPDIDAVLISASTSDAFQDFPTGSNMKPNSNHNYTPVTTQLLMANRVSNNTFTSTSAANSWDNWTQTHSAGSQSTVVATFSDFYTKGAAMLASTEPTADNISTYLTYDNTISVSTTTPYRFFLNYKTGDQSTPASYLRLNYYDTADAPCSTAYQMIKLDNSTAWRQSVYKINPSTSPAYKQVEKVTTDAFKLPQDCSKIKPVVYFHYDTSIATKFYLDSMKISEHRKGDIFSTNSTNKVAVGFKENLPYPDTPYCSFFCDYRNTVNDTVRSVNGTITGTANYVSSAFFSKIGTAFGFYPHYRNYMANGHFDNDTASWFSSSLVTFATSSAASLFGDLSLKIKGVSDDQYVYQNISLSNNLKKTFSFYCKPIAGDGVRLVGMLSGATQFDYSNKYTTSNWQRFIYNVTSVDSVRIYPYYHATSFTGNGSLYLDGVQLLASASYLHSIYDDTYNDGASYKGRVGISYPDTILDTSAGTLEFWIRQQNTQDETGVADKQVFHWGSTSGILDGFWSLNNVGGVWTWYLANNGAANYKLIRMPEAHNPEPNELQHIVLTWGADGSGNTRGTMYVNGVKCTAAIDGFSFGWEDNILHIPSHVGKLYIGSQSYMSTASPTDFYLDAFRVEKCQYDQIHVDKDYKANIMEVRA